MLRLLRRGSLFLAFAAGMGTTWYMKRLFNKPMPLAVVPNLENATEGDYIAALHDKDWHMRLWGAQMLAEHPTEWAIEGLVKTLQDADPDVRDASVNALSRLGNAASQAVIPILQSWSLEAREAAVEVLAAISDSPALDALTRAILEDNSPWIRIPAIEAIGRQRDTRFYPLLVKALQDEHEGVYLAAKKALLELDTPEAQAAIDAYPYIDSQTNNNLEGLS
jgi:HEAT repeat-containing taxis protein